MIAEANGPSRIFHISQLRTFTNLVRPNSVQITNGEWCFCFNYSLNFIYFIIIIDINHWEHGNRHRSDGINYRRTVDLTTRDTLNLVKWLIPVCCIVPLLVGTNQVQSSRDRTNMGMGIRIYEQSHWNRWIYLQLEFISRFVRLTIKFKVAVIWSLTTEIFLEFHIQGVLSWKSDI